MGQVAEIKYSISVLKNNPLVKIKVTGIYNQNFAQFYYRNPVTGRWCLIQDELDADTNQEQSLLALFKKITCTVKNLADRFYEDSKELFDDQQHYLTKSRI